MSEKVLKKKLVGHPWGAPNLNYLLVMVPTFVMPFSITLIARVTQDATHRGRHECIRVLDNQHSCAQASTLIGNLAIALENALSVRYFAQVHMHGLQTALSTLIPICPSYLFICSSFPTNAIYTN